MKKTVSCSIFFFLAGLALGIFWSKTVSPHLINPLNNSRAWYKYLSNSGAVEAAKRLRQQSVPLNSATKKYYSSTYLDLLFAKRSLATESISRASSLEDLHWIYENYLSRHDCGLLEFSSKLVNESYLKEDPDYLDKLQALESEIAMLKNAQQQLNAFLLKQILMLPRDVRPPSESSNGNKSEDMFK